MTEFQAGEMLANYRLLERIGEGGMGVIWKAEDTRLDRAVAIKVLPGEVTGDPEKRQRFRREAKSAAALNHPNITVIYEIGEVGSTLFIVMELVTGGSLRDRIRQGAVPERELAPIAVSIANALAHAHALGIIHRDLKPDNVMLTGKGEVKLVDFGLAKLLKPSLGSGPEQSIKETISAELTREGSFAGTVAYMAPELIRGKQADGRSDQFSLGVLLYEAAAGRRPFEEESWAAVLAKILESEPPQLQSVAPQVSGDFARIIHRCLKKNPAERYRETAALAEEMGSLREGSTPSSESLPTPQPAPAARGFWTWQKILASAIALQAVILAFFLGIYPRLTRKTPAPAPAVMQRSGSIAVAVLPFEFHGDNQFAYLGDGIVRLLGAALDGAGSLRSVDPRAILGAVERNGGSLTDAGAARKIASRIGATSFIMGDIVEAGGRLRLQASLYKSEGGDAPVVRAEVEGKADEIFSMVDNVAGQILAAQPSGPTDRVTRVAAVTTHSIAALKAFLEGEARFREGKGTQAIEAYQRAISEDPKFALAYYRLSIAAEYAFQSGMSKEAAENAVKNSERLSQHDRLLLNGLLAWRRGDAVEAERLYRNIVGQYPDEVEAWFELGEVLFHGGPPRGNPIQLAREPFEKVIYFEPDHVPVMLHLARLAAADGRLSEVADWERRVLRLNPQGDRAMEAKGLMAVATRDPKAMESFLADARQSNDNGLIIAANILGGFAPDSDDAIPLLEVLAEPSRAPEARTIGHVWLAHMHAWRGRMASARSELQKAESVNPAWAIEYSAVLALAPIAPPSRQSLQDLHARLSRWDAAAVPASVSNNNWIIAHDGLHPALRRYLLGLVAARLGKPEEALRHAAALEKMSLPAVSLSLRELLVRSLKGHVAMAGGRTREVLAILDPPVPRIPYQMMIGSTFYSLPHDRYLFAQAAEASGRDEEALRWYNSFDHYSTYEAIFQVPSLLRMGRIYEKLGRGKDAALQYQKVVDLWSGADAELKPVLDEARSALARLAK